MLAIRGVEGDQEGVAQSAQMLGALDAHSKEKINEGPQHQGPSDTAHDPHARPHRPSRQIFGSWLRLSVSGRFVERAAPLLFQSRHQLYESDGIEPEVADQCEPFGYRPSSILEQRTSETFDSVRFR